MKKINKFLSETSGHVAIIFGLSVLPIVAIIGFAMDFSSLSTNKNRVQHVLDSTVLAGARAMQAGKNENQIRVVMKDYMDGQNEANKNGTNLRCDPLKVSFPQGTKDIEAEIKCRQDTMLMQVVGKDETEFKVSSASTWGIGKLDVAFMFDVSGSMAWNNRMESLKAAAGKAIDTLKPADGGVATEDVRIAMVSYNAAVNAGDEFTNVTGLAPKRKYYATDKYQKYEDVTRTETNRERVCDSERYCKRKFTNGRKKGQCKKWGYRDTNCRWEDVTRDVTTQEWVDYEREVSREINNTCVWERYGVNAFNDKAPNSGTVVNPKPPTIGVDRIDNATKPIYNADPTNDQSRAYLSAGYAYFNDNSSRNQDNSWTVRTPSCSNHKPLPLTDNRTTLHNYVKGLTTGGGTAGQQGIAWAWYLVSEDWNQVFPGSSAPLDYDEPDSVKAVILMTDGEFNAQEFGHLGNSDQQARALCDAMKAQDKVVIYTVAFQAPPKGKQVLSYCASGPEFAFSPENGDELEQAYQAIATSISDLRVTF